MDRNRQTGFCLFLRKIVRCTSAYMCTQRLFFGIIGCHVQNTQKTEEKMYRQVRLLQGKVRKIEKMMEKGKHKKAQNLHNL